MPITVTIFGSNDLLSRQLTVHAMAKGWKVRYFSRNIDALLDADLRSDQFEAIKGYVFDEQSVAKAIKTSNYVLCTLGGAENGIDHTRSLGMKNVVVQMTKMKVNRLVALGGIGILDHPDGNGYYVDHKDYPKEGLQVGLEHKKALHYLLSAVLDWTMICPFEITQTPDILPFAATTTSETIYRPITAGTLALFMVEALQKNAFLHQRVAISNV